MPNEYNFVSYEAPLVAKALSNIASSSTCEKQLDHSFSIILRCSRNPQDLTPAKWFLSLGHAEGVLAR